MYFFACSRCLKKQSADGRCAFCGADAMFDLRSRAARELFEGNERRASEKRAGWVRFGAVVITIVIVLPLAIVLRQLELMPRYGFFFAVIGGAIGLEVGLEKLLGRKHSV